MTDTYAVRTRIEGKDHIFQRWGRTYVLVPGPKEMVISYPWPLAEHMHHGTTDD